jgi:hypothetical protein
MLRFEKYWSVRSLHVFSGTELVLNRDLEQCACTPGNALPARLSPAVPQRRPSSPSRPTAEPDRRTPGPACGPVQTDMLRDPLGSVGICEAGSGQRLKKLDKMDMTSRDLLGRLALLYSSVSFARPWICPESLCCAKLGYQCRPVRRGVEGACQAGSKAVPSWQHLNAAVAATNASTVAADSRRIHDHQPHEQTFEAECGCLPAPHDAETDPHRRPSPAREQPSHPNSRGHVGRHRHPDTRAFAVCFSAGQPDGKSSLPLRAPARFRGFKL